MRAHAQQVDSGVRARARAVVRRQKWTPRRAWLAAAAACIVILASTYTTLPALALDLLPPVAVDDTLTTTHSRTRIVPAPGVFANDLDLDGGTVAILESGATHGSVTLRSDGGYSYTPIAGYVGSDEFTYRASSGALPSLTSAPATVSITVTNGLPNLEPDEYTVAAGTTRFVAAPGVLANDSDPDGDELSAGLVTTVSHGALNLATSGAFAYTPATGYAGTDEFTYRAWDGVAWSKHATVTLTVASPASPAPTKTPKPTPSPAKTPKPSPTPEPTPTPTAAQTPRRSRSSSPATPKPTASPNAPGAGTIGGGGEPGGPGNVVEPLGVRPVRFGLNDAVFGDFAGFGGIEWVVPALALGVPGLLMLVALLAQALIGVIWLTYARRRLRGLGVRLLTRSGRGVP